MRLMHCMFAFGAMAALAACGAPSAEETVTHATPEPNVAEAPAPAAPEPITVADDPNAVCGESSWYGNELAGRPTASGEPFAPQGLTAAHRTLPFDTVIRVELDDRQVDVRVNDRGPFHGNRILDLSRGAADQIGLTDLGSARICYVVVSGG